MGSIVRLQRPCEACDESFPMSELEFYSSDWGRPGRMLVCQPCARHMAQWDDSREPEINGDR